MLLALRQEEFESWSLNYLYVSERKESLCINTKLESELVACKIYYFFTRNVNVASSAIHKRYIYSIYYTSFNPSKLPAGDLSLLFHARHIHIYVLSHVYMLNVQKGVFLPHGLMGSKIQGVLYRHFSAIPRAQEDEIYVIYHLASPTRRKFF